MSTTTVKRMFGLFALAAMLVTAAALPVGAALPGTAAAINDDLGEFRNDVSVRIDGNTVYVSGAVGTEGEKREIMDRVEHAAGRKVIHESIEVFGGNDA